MALPLWVILVRPSNAPALGLSLINSSAVSTQSGWGITSASRKPIHVPVEIDIPVFLAVAGPEFFMLVHCSFSSDLDLKVPNISKVSSVEPSSAIAISKKSFFAD